MPAPKPKRQIVPHTLEAHYQDFKGRFLQHRENLKLPVNAQKSVHLGLPSAFTHRIVQNTTRNRKLGFILEISKEGNFGTLMDKIPGRLKHLIDAEQHKSPQKKLEMVHALQKDIVKMQQNLKRQKKYIQLRMKIKPGSSEELANAKRGFGEYAEGSIKGLDGRLLYAMGTLRELEQKYLAEERK